MELTSARDAKEGARAFVERREPRFEDRLGENMSDWYPWVSGIFRRLEFGLGSCC